MYELVAIIPLIGILGVEDSTLYPIKSIKSSLQYYVPLFFIITGPIETVNTSEAALPPNTADYVAVPVGVFRISISVYFEDIVRSFVSVKIKFAAV